MCSIPATYPPEWARFPNELSGSVTLDVAGYATRVEIAPEQLERVYLPLLALLERKHAERCGQRLRGDRHPVHPGDEHPARDSGDGHSDHHSGGGHPARLLETAHSADKECGTGVSPVLSPSVAGEDTGEPVALTNNKGGQDAHPPTRPSEGGHPARPSEGGHPARHSGGGHLARLLVGLAGIPGGGKSTFTAILTHIAERVLPPGIFVTIGMDGWHLPNAILDRRWTTDEHGHRIPLRRRKGGPQSFDVSAMTAALRQLRETRRPVRLPVYDRRLHDPVPDGLTVGPAADIVLIEGNYLLCENPPWNEVAALLDVKLYLESDPALARERMIARHIRGGCSEAEAVRKYQENDAANTKLVQSFASRADYTVRP